MQSKKSLLTMLFRNSVLDELTVAQLKEANKKFGCKYAPQWLIKNADFKIGKSMFQIAS